MTSLCKMKLDLGLSYSVACLLTARPTATWSTVTLFRSSANCSMASVASPV